MRAAENLLVVWLPFVLVLACGCSREPQLAEVSGTVRAGGQPLDNVLVTFIPQEDGPAAAVRSMATTDSQGRYELKTEGQESGATVGKHKVTVEDLAIYRAPRAPDGTVLVTPAIRFDSGYSDPLRSPLSREVQPGEQTIDLELVAAP